MAVNTAEKRFSLIAEGNPAGRLSMPVPGSARLAFRRHLLGLYAFGPQLDESLPSLINAAYFVVKRYLQGKWVYVTERMDDRLWNNIEDSWCVDCALSLPLYSPAATLTASFGPDAAAKRNAMLALGRPAGVVRMPPPGSFGITDRQILLGAYDFVGFAADAMVFQTDADIFTASMVGDVIRMGGGKATITSFLGSRAVVGDVTQPITALIPDDPEGTPLPAQPGSWTIGVPVTTITGLNHLEGKTVSILADGTIVPPQVVTNGSITLDVAASNVVAGLPFAAQIQTLPLEIPAPVTIQGRRKTIFNVVARVTGTPGPFEVGTNQPDASIEPNQATVPWANMTPAVPPFGSASPQEPYEFYTGDIFIDVADALGGYKAQVAAQQLQPVPLNLIALVPWVQISDDPG